MKKTCMHSFLIISLLVLLSCAVTSTQINTTWKAPGYSGEIQKVLIIGVSNVQADRIRYENYFAENLRKHGIAGIQSFPIFSSTGIPNKETIASAVKKSGTDTILLTQLVEREKVEKYVPGEAFPAHSDFFGYYSGSWQNVYTPGYKVTNRVVVMQTNLYGAENQKLFWTAVSDTTTSGTDADIIKSFVKAIVNKMQQEGLIR